MEPKATALRGLCLGAVVVFLAGCATEKGDSGDAVLTPFEVLSNPERFDGEAITINGWLDFGFERRHLLETAEHQAQPTRRCISVEIDSSVRPDAERLNHTNVLVEGIFHADLAAGRIFLGLCSDEGLKVRSIAPVPG